MRCLILVIVSFDKPVYYDMFRVWRERCKANNDVWFIQCKPASEWIGDIVNDIRERSKAPFGCRRWNIEDVHSLMNPPSLGSAPLIHSQQSLLQSHIALCLLSLDEVDLQVSL